MVTIAAALIGPQADGTAPRNNPLDVERHMLWMQYGRAGITKGLVPSVVSGQMQLSFTAGSAVVCERDGSQNELDRAYPLYNNGTAIVQFGAASASNRNDAVVLAAVDVEDGAQGTGAIGVGGHLVVVPGVSGTTAVRTNAEIAAFLGRGGWSRIYDVPIASGSTQISLAGATFTGFKHFDWNNLQPTLTAASGFSITYARYMLHGPMPMCHITMWLVRTGGTINADTEGNFGDIVVAQNLPTSLRAIGNPAYGTFHVPGTILGSARIETDGQISITDMHSDADIATSNNIRIDFDYPLLDLA